MIYKELRESSFISNISLLQAYKRSMTGLQYFGFILASFLGNQLEIHVLGDTFKTLFSKCSVRAVLFASDHCFHVYGSNSQSLRFKVASMIKVLPLQ